MMKKYDLLHQGRGLLGQKNLAIPLGVWRLTLEDIEADTAKLVNVGVVDLGHEADLGRSHGVVLGQEQLQLEDTAYLHPQLRE